MRVSRTAVFLSIMLYLAYAAGALDATRDDVGNYPTKPIRMLLGAPTGGGSNLSARVVANELSKSLGQQVIVDNRVGAGHIIASEMRYQGSTEWLHRAVDQRQPCPESLCLRQVALRHGT